MHMKFRYTFLCLPLLLCFAACAYVTLTPVNPGDKDSTEVEQPAVVAVGNEVNVGFLKPSASSNNIHEGIDWMKDVSE